MENDDIIVSIGLPVYNGEKFLKKRIDNILNQTHQNIELIISDNHSNDRTSEICKRYESKDIRIKYYFQEKQIPITKNFGFVLAKSTGKYFAWASIDDILESTFIEKNLRILETFAIPLDHIKGYLLQIRNLIPYRLGNLHTFHVLEYLHLLLF